MSLPEELQPAVLEPAMIVDWLAREEGRDMEDEIPEEELDASDSFDGLQAEMTMDGDLSMIQGELRGGRIHAGRIEVAH